jgi:hypothetical protein
MLKMRSKNLKLLVGKQANENSELFKSEACLIDARQRLRGGMPANDKSDFLDQYCTYTTAKMVIVRDYKLGLIYYSFLVAITICTVIDNSRCYLERHQHWKLSD